MGLLTNSSSSERRFVFAKANISSVSTYDSLAFFLAICKNFTKSSQLPVKCTNLDSCFHKFNVLLQPILLEENKTRKSIRKTDLAGNKPLYYTGTHNDLNNILYGKQKLENNNVILGLKTTCKEHINCSKFVKKKLSLYSTIHPYICHLTQIMGVLVPIQRISCSMVSLSIGYCNYLGTRCSKIRFIFYLP